MFKGGLFCCIRFKHCFDFLSNVSIPLSVGSGWLSRRQGSSYQEKQYDIIFPEGKDAKSKTLVFSDTKRKITIGHYFFLLRFTLR